MKCDAFSLDHKTSLTQSLFSLQIKQFRWKEIQGL